MKLALSTAVRMFVECINYPDLDSLIRMMADDHVFVDATGIKHGPKDTMAAGWKEYFAAFPDYKIRMDELTWKRNGLVIFTDTASGSYQGKGQRWTVPAAWRAVVRDEKIAVWQVFCDVEPMVRSMGIDRFAS